MREDVGVDHVELRLDLVAADVVGGAGVLVQDQVLGAGWEPVTETMNLPTVHSSLHGDNERR